MCIEGRVGERGKQYGTEVVSRLGSQGESSSSSRSRSTQTPAQGEAGGYPDLCRPAVWHLDGEPGAGLHDPANQLTAVLSADWPAHMSGHHSS